jgi:hypothetical protein
LLRGTRMPRSSYEHINKMAMGSERNTPTKPQGITSPLNCSTIQRRERKEMMLRAHPPMSCTVKMHAASAGGNTRFQERTLRCHGVCVRCSVEQLMASLDRAPGLGHLKKKLTRVAEKEHTLVGEWGPTGAMRGAAFKVFPRNVCMISQSASAITCPPRTEIKSVRLRHPNPSFSCANNVQNWRKPFSEAGNILWPSSPRNVENPSFKFGPFPPFLSSSRSAPPDALSFCLNFLSFLSPVTFCLNSLSLCLNSLSFCLHSLCFCLNSFSFCLSSLRWLTRFVVLG